MPEWPRRVLAPTARLDSRRSGQQNIEPITLGLMEDFNNWPRSWKTFFRVAAWLFGGGITLLIAFNLYQALAH